MKPWNCRALTVLVAAGLLVTSILQRAPAQDPPNNRPEIAKLEKLLDDVSLVPTPSPLAATKSSDNQITKLRKERYECAFDELKAWADSYRSISLPGPLEGLLKCYTTRILEAELSLCQTPEDRASVYARALAAARALEQMAGMRYNAGRITVQESKAAKYLRLDLEIKSLEAKEEAAKAKQK